jgi:predicted nucleic acid-binding protein
VIVADTGAVLALLDADDKHHHTLRRVFEASPGAWLLPWAILPEVDYLALTQLGPRTEQAFIEDLSSGAFTIEWGMEGDLQRASELNSRHRTLKLGLVDTVVMAVAERRGAEAIATLDLRHFGTVKLQGQPKLIPRDL